MRTCNGMVERPWGDFSFRGRLRAGITESPECTEPSGIRRKDTDPVPSPRDKVAQVEDEWEKTAPLWHRELLIAMPLRLGIWRVMLHFEQCHRRHCAGWLREQ